MNRLQIHFSLLTVLSLSFLLSACNGGNPKNIDPNESALPHGQALPNTELSAEDKLKLGQAKGRKAGIISVEDVESMFDAAQGKLHIFNFWDFKCKECQKMNKHLQQIAAETSLDKLKIVLINIDGIKARAKVNTYIRENNIITETYILNSASDKWMDGIHEDWDGELPSIFLVNESEETNQLVQSFMEKGEFQAIVESLSL